MIIKKIFYTNNLVCIKYSGIFGKVDLCKIILHGIQDKLFKK